MKKCVVIFSVVLFISFNILIVSSIAQPKSYKQGIYTDKQLNLDPNTVHTIQNTSTNEYAFLIIFDSNQIVQQIIQIEPKSQNYNLETLLPGYVIVIIGKADIIIS
ncbi:MAG: hypothetical protein LLF98_08620 [Clostridium sp.]|uniref:hypothetical protein n=1 Tax=Clostridium sp. TaxID=1506 RepID=UPI0025C23B6F|nr:hypothetical protein [Clostridium sp.]MCE5221312.1 hypothetical protein [Clostridium sp.]